MTNVNKIVYLIIFSDKKDWMECKIGTYWQLLYYRQDTYCKTLVQWEINITWQQYSINEEMNVAFSPKTARTM